MTATATTQEPRRPPPARTPATRAVRLGGVLLALVPGVLVVYFSFASGGFFPGSVGVAAVLVIELLILRVLLADDPFAGVTPGLVVVVVLFTAYAGWTLASQLWSETPDRALVEFDRALLYLLVLVLFGLVSRTPGRMPWIHRGLAAGMVLVCAAGLTSRTLPDVWPTAATIANDRLSYPLTYWNTLGILAAIGTVLTIGLATNGREPRIVRVAGSAAVPVLAATLFFTFSRGGMVAALVGVAAYVLLARSAGLVGGLLAALPPTVVAVVVAYRADLLATRNPTSAAAVAQGEDVALAVVVCALAAAGIRLATLPLDNRIARIAWRPRPVLVAAVVVVALGSAAAAAVAAGTPSFVADQYREFIRGAPTGSDGGDLRSRLTNPSNNGRTDHWRLALAAYREAPLRGTGAGTYQFVWDERRPDPFIVSDAHNLYVETLAELGLVGIVLLAGALLAIVVALGLGARGPSRGTYAALLAAVLAWAIHAGIDWDWEMPAVTAWVFAVGGAALAAPARPPGTALGDRWRIPIAVLLLLVAVTPALLALSQLHLQRAASALARGDCRVAKERALASVEVLAVRAEAYEIVGYCALSTGRPRDAVAAMSKAVQRQPQHWQPRLGLALALAAAGEDPRVELRMAGRLNPREALIRAARSRFGSSARRTWPEAAEDLAVEALAAGTLRLR